MGRRVRVRAPAGGTVTGGMSMDTSNSGEPPPLSGSRRHQAVAAVPAYGYGRWWQATTL